MIALLLVLLLQDPVPTFEADGSTQARVTLGEIAAFPERHEGRWTLDGLELSDVRRIGTGDDAIYPASLRDPEREEGTGTLYVWIAPSIGERVYRLAREHEPHRARVTVAVAREGRDYGLTLLRVEWLDGEGHVVARVP